MNIVSGRKALYVCALYHTQLSIIDNGTESNWVRAVRQLLFECGFGEGWHNQGVGDTEMFINLFKQRVYDIYKQSWESGLLDSSRATFYRAIKDMHMKSNYMGIVNVGCHRSAMIKLTTNSHRLAIETGRWALPVVPRDQRACPVCSVSHEDEYHSKKVIRNLANLYTKILFYERPTDNQASLCHFDVYNAIESLIAFRICV